MSSLTLPDRRPVAVAPPPAGRPASRQADPRWVRAALLLLLASTAALYLWGLGASGWANDFYSAATQAATKSWKAWFFGSSDAANFITVDKAPAALWVMGLSARLFGVDAWSILVPQALAGVGSVALLYATVRRWFRPGAALLAGLVLATTPVAALLFRFNNPDALLVLLLVGAAYAMTRAVESGRTGWLVLSGWLVGFGFLAKMLQALLVVPALGLVYLVAGPPKLGRRVVQLLWGGLALIAGGGWWVAIVSLWPASSRPYIGGSQNNTVWNLMFGYNGFGRLTGNEAGSVGGGGPGGPGGAGGGSRWGPVGWTRLFNSQFGGQIAWVLPAALIVLGATLWITRRAPRTNRTRAAMLLWGGWLVVTAITFSLGQGIIHPYYSVALAPAIGAVAGIGTALLWSRRRDPVSRSLLAATLAASAVWSYALLRRTPTWHPELATAVVVGGMGVALALLFVHRLDKVAAAAGVALALAGPAAYTLATAATPHSGAIPSAGPTVVGRFGARPGGGRGGPGGQVGGFGGGPGGGSALGGLLNGSRPSAEVTSFLQQGSKGYTWVAATVGSNTAAGYQLATDDPVMAIGGFNGTDPAPTLAQFQAFVAAGKIHWFIPGGRGPQASGATIAQEISSWVARTFPSTTVGGVTLYDLSGASA